MTSMDEMRDVFSSISLWSSWSDGLLNIPSPVLKNMILRGSEALSAVDPEKNRTCWREDRREAASRPLLLAHQRIERLAGNERAPILDGASALGSGRTLNSKIFSRSNT